MTTIDRVMRAYARKYPMTERRAAFVHEELCRIIDELKAHSQQQPSLVPETEIHEDENESRG